MARFELFGTASCPYTLEMREWLEWKGYDFEEYDVEADPSARARMIAISGGQRTVPILADEGGVVQIGWQGRGCVVAGHEETRMHELSIAMSILEMATEEAEQRGVTVTAIHLRLGPLAGVVKSALLSAFEMACEHSPLQACRLVIEELPIVVFCPQCCRHRELPSMQSFTCPSCGTPVSEVLQGRELEVRALEIQELEVFQ